MSLDRARDFIADKLGIDREEIAVSSFHASRADSYSDLAATATFEAPAKYMDNVDIWYHTGTGVEVSKMRVTKAGIAEFDVHIDYEKYKGYEPPTVWGDKNAETAVRI